MDPRLRRRILAFYFAGFVNLVLGLYVMIYGRAILEPGTWLLLMTFFFGFTAVDFWFPRVLKRKWLEAQAQQQAQQQKSG